MKPSAEIAHVSKIAKQSPYLEKNLKHLSKPRECMQCLRYAESVCFIPGVSGPRAACGPPGPFVRPAMLFWEFLNN